jgi:hypothetical protein
MIRDKRECPESQTARGPGLSPTALIYTAQYQVSVVASHSELSSTAAAQTSAGGRPSLVGLRKEKKGEQPGALGLAAQARLPAFLQRGTEWWPSRLANRRVPSRRIDVSRTLAAVLQRPVTQAYWTKVPSTLVQTAYSVRSIPYSVKYSPVPKGPAPAHERGLRYQETNK